MKGLWSHGNKKFHLDKMKTYFSMSLGKRNKYKGDLMILISTRKTGLRWWAESPWRLHIWGLCPASLDQGRRSPQRDSAGTGGTDKPDTTVGTARRDWNLQEQRVKSKSSFLVSLPQPPKLSEKVNGIKFRKQREITQPIHSYDASISETTGKSKIAKTVVLPSPSWNTDKDEKGRLGELKLVRSVTLTSARFWGIWMSTSHSTLALSDKWNKILYFNLLLYSQPRAYNF